MTRLILVWLFCFLCLAVDRSSAAIHPTHGGIAGNVVLCPQGGGANDNGCAASPGGNYQVANFFTGYTGTVYSGRPSFNVPGVDYPVGVPAAASGSICGGTLQDPATATHSGSSDNPGCGIIPQHCAYSTSIISAQLTVPFLTCSGTSNAITLKGFELGPVGGHGSTYWYFDGTTSGNDVIEYNDMVGDPGVYYQNAFGSVASGTTGNVSLIANNLFGKWVSNFSTQGTGSCTIATTAMTCTGDSGFAVGQYINGTSVSFNTNIIAVNGGGSYTLNQSNTVSSAETITSQFQMAGGINIVTPGQVIFQYNAATQINGRIATVLARTSGNTATTAGDVAQQYNYFEAGIYSNAEVAHYENVEYVLADAGAPMTWTNLNFQGNILYQSSAVQTGTGTATFFISTGGVSAPTAGNYLVTYTNPVMDKNIVIGQDFSGVLGVWGGQTLTNITITSNWLSKKNGGSYNACDSNPNAVGGGAGPVAFFVGSDNGAGTLTVTNYQGGAAIAFNSTMYVAESHGLITGQTSGTPGGNGVYTVTGDISVTSQNMRSATPAITNTPTISGNMDIDSNSAISTSAVITREVSSNPCVYPGMQ